MHHLSAKMDKKKTNLVTLDDTDLLKHLKQKT